MAINPNPGYPPSWTSSITGKWTEGLSSNLTRSDFKRVDLKGMAGRYYFSYKQGPIEITLEPCLNGFDIGFYKNESSSEDKKTCTNVTFPVYLDEERVYKEESTKMEAKESTKLHERLMVMDMFSTQERSNQVWDKGLAIANEKLRVHRADQHLKKWKMIEKEGDEIPDYPYSTPPYSVPPQITTPIDPYIYQCKDNLTDAEIQQIKSYLNGMGPIPKIDGGSNTAGTVSTGT